MKKLIVFLAITLIVVGAGLVQAGPVVETTPMGFNQQFFPLIVAQPGYDPGVCVVDPPNVVQDLGQWTWQAPYPEPLPGVPCFDTIILGLGDMYGVPAPMGTGFARTWDHTQNPRASIDLQHSGTFRMWRISGTDDFVQTQIGNLVPISADWRVPVMPFPIYGPGESEVGTDVAFSMPRDWESPTQPVTFEVDASGGASFPLNRTAVEWE